MSFSLLPLVAAACIGAGVVVVAAEPHPPLGRQPQGQAAGMLTATRLRVEYLDSPISVVSGALRVASFATHARFARPVLQGGCLGRA